MRLDDQIDETVRSIWQAMFGAELVRAPAVPADVLGGVTGFVSLDGAFHGGVVVQCTADLAQAVTATMFGSEQTPDPADVRDAVGELANMIAGNIKPLLPGPSAIGLPVVAFGTEVQILRTQPVGQVGFSSGGQPMLVTLLQRSDPPDEE